MQMPSISNSSLKQTVLNAAKASQQGDFARLLNRSTSPKGREMSESQKQEVRKAAQQLVSSALILPMLAQIRKSPFKSDLFDGGFTEEAFGAQLDTELADRMVSKSNFSIVEAIYQKMVNPRGKQPAGKELNIHG